MDRRFPEIVHQNDAVTPAVAIVLMLAITVLMVAVAAPLVLTSSDRVVDDRPELDVSFSYTEDVDGSETDTFGRSGAETGGSGQLAVTVESGGPVPAGELRVRGTAGAGSLAGETDAFEEDDTVLAGDELVVWAARGETVQLVWTAPEGEDSVVLAEFTVFPS